MSVLGFELKDADDNVLGCKDLELSLTSVQDEEAEDDSEVDVLLGGVLRTYADKLCKLVELVFECRCVFLSSLAPRKIGGVTDASPVCVCDFVCDNRSLS